MPLLTHGYNNESQCARVLYIFALILLQGSQSTVIFNRLTGILTDVPGDAPPCDLVRKLLHLVTGMRKKETDDQQHHSSDQRKKMTKLSEGNRVLLWVTKFLRPDSHLPCLWTEMTEHPPNLSTINICNAQLVRTK